MSPRVIIGSLAAVAAVAAIVVLIVSCGNDDGGDPGAAGDDPAATEEVEPPTGEAAEAFQRDACELLTNQDVRAIIGEQVQGRYTEGDAEAFTPGQCEWATGEPTDFDEPRPSGITLFLGDEQIFENNRVLAEHGEDYAELDGIGDEAYAGGGEAGVMFDEVGVTVTLIGINTNDPATHDVLIDVLERVAENY